MRNVPKLLTTLAAAAAILTLPATGAEAATDDSTWQLTEHQMGIPGPPKLAMTEADTSGRPNTDARFIADRLAILNHMTAYSFLIDEGRWDQWYGLFSDDIVFESTAPCVGTLVTRGKKAMRAFTDLRYLAGGKSTAMRRHTMGNVHVAEQTATTAKVRSYMLISSVPAADKLAVVTTGTYNADMQKRDGRWTITRWYIEVDAQLSPSAIPQDFPVGAVSFVPDAREACVKK